MAVFVQWSGILSFLTLFLVCSGQDSANDLLTSAKKGLPELRKSFEELAPALNGTLEALNATGKLPDLPFAVNMSSLPSIEEGDELIEEKCLKNGGNGSYAEAMVAKEELHACMKDMLDFNKINAEIEKAKPTGDLDKVFRKYCRSTPKLKGCITNFTTSIEPCLEDSEKISKHIIMNITTALEQFICYKEGDRIALFIGEGGKECLMDKKEAIELCLNVTFKKYLPTDKKEVTQLQSLPMFKLDEDECLKINELQKCVVAELTKCKEPTPANIVDSLMNFVRQKTPCRDHKPEGVGAGAHITSNTVTLVAAVLFVITLTGRQRLH